MAIKKTGVAMAFVPEDRLGMGLVGSMGMTGNMMLRSWRIGKGLCQLLGQEVHSPVVRGSFEPKEQGADVSGVEKRCHQQFQLGVQPADLRLRAAVAADFLQMVPAGGTEQVSRRVFPTQYADRWINQIQQPAGEIPEHHSTASRRNLPRLV